MEESFDDNIEIDADKLLFKVNSGGKLTSIELSTVVDLLNRHQIKKDFPGVSWDEIYSYILLLNRAKALEYRQVVARYLECQDSFIVALVLETLCLSWKGTEDYLEQVINFALGVAWDIEDDVRQIGLKILGEYLRETPVWQTVHYRQILDLLLTTFSNTLEDHWTRQNAYYALCRAGGRAWNEVPSECKKLMLSMGSEDIDWQLVERLQSSVSSSEAKISDSGEG